MTLISGWHVVACISATTALAASMLDLALLFLHSRVQVQRQLLLGISVFSAWLNICRYFEFDKRLYLCFVIMKKGLPVLVSYLCSVLPLFLAFAFFGIALFSRFEGTLFPDLDQSVATLFSVVHGDSILDIFAKIHYGWPVVSSLYMIFFITLFICIVLSNFIAIVQDSYALARKELYGKDLTRLGYRSLKRDFSINVHNNGL